jgi:hypothetical protein
MSIATILCILPPANEFRAGIINLSLPSISKLIVIPIPAKEGGEEPYVSGQFGAVYRLNHKRKHKTVLQMAEGLTAPLHFLCLTCE